MIKDLEIRDLKTERRTILRIREAEAVDSKPASEPQP
jgi:hypothetical protein